MGWDKKEIVKTGRRSSVVVFSHGDESDEDPPKYPRKKMAQLVKEANDSMARRGGRMSRGRFK